MQFVQPYVYYALFKLSL